MENFNVYITAKKRDIGAKVDYSVIFEKNGIVWYRFARKVIDRNNIGGDIGYIEAVKLAIKFAKENNMFITIFSTKHIIEDSVLSGKVKSKCTANRKFKDDYFIKYLELIKNSKNFEFNFIKTIENPFFDYGRNIAVNKFKKAI